MQTQVQNPQTIFTMPQRLLVPLFQRPYVWNEELQWAPLWADVERLADKVLDGDSIAQHFLGAVVIQQEPNPIGTLTTRTIIDGQQRLITLQLLFDAIHEEVSRLGLTKTAMRIVELVENAEHHWREAEDRFKVWPTNRDREAFAEVMGVETPEHSNLTHSAQRIVKAHEYFSRRVRDWLGTDQESLDARASTLVDAVATRLQLAVIELKAEEDAQEIFETLNARGTPLTAADLIKNLVFQRLAATPEESEKAYHRYWEQFETPFWEKEVASGRVLWSRSSLFLTQWLTAQTQQDIPAREVFVSFKRHLDDSGMPITDMLTRIRDCASVYQDLLEATADHHRPLTTDQRFTYRTTAMQSEIVKPLMIWLTDPALPAVPPDELAKGLNALESWLVRRMLVREKSAGQNRFLVDLLAEIVQVDRSEVGTRISQILAEQTADVSYWPDDDAVRASLMMMPVYRRLSRGRLRMVLEAIEDYRRGFGGSHTSAKGEQPVVREECTIEHVMPQKWGQHWPLPDGVTSGDRDDLIHTLGNLTLVSAALNPSMSNAAWEGEQGKRAALQTYSSIKLSADAIARADARGSGWDESLIQERTEAMIDDILAIWSAPQGHSNSGRHSGSPTSDTTLRDLLVAGLASVGDILVSSRAGCESARAVIANEDGLLNVEGRLYETPSGAARAATKRTHNGWSFWRLGSTTGPRLKDLRRRLAPVAGDSSGHPSVQELPIDTKWARLDALLAALPDRTWAAYGDVATVVGTHPVPLGQRLAAHDVPNAHRVLQTSGAISPNFRWENSDCSEDPRVVLEAEGIRFDGNGLASQDQRLSVEELAALLQD